MNKMSSYAQNTEQLTGGLEQVKAIPESLESKALETSGLSAVGEQTKKIEMLSSPDPEQLKQEAIDQVKQEAVNHFAERENELSVAFSRINKLKGKYSNVSGLRNIPKRRPNPMRGKPIKERLLPQTVFQILGHGDNLVVDCAAYFGMRLTGQLTVGGGWNQRVGYPVLPKSRKLFCMMNIQSSYQKHML